MHFTVYAPADVGGGLESRTPVADYLTARYMFLSEGARIYSETVDLRDTGDVSWEYVNDVWNDYLALNSAMHPANGGPVIGTECKVAGWRLIIEP